MSQELRPATLAGARLEQYFHTCAFFRSREEEYQVLGPFIAEGLQWGEKALHFCDPDLCADHLTRLAGCGIDVDDCVQRGLLDVLSWQEAYLIDGCFDQDRMIQTVQATFQKGLDDGYPRSRVVGHMDWVLDGHPGADQIIEYEVRVNEVLSRSRQPAVCIYDLNRLTGTMMMDVLRTHPLTLVGGVLHENPFYTPPEKMLAELRARPRAAAARPSTPAS